jgi:predicted nucleic acid-binding protein
MSALVFVDTNVLVYARDRSEGAKQEAALAWLEFLWSSRRGRLSPQVLHEYYVTVTQKLTPGLSRETARADVRSLFTWRPVMPGLEVIETAWRIQDQHRLSWWDALIVAAASAARCKYILTEDLNHGQQLENLEVVSPFLRVPESLD